MRAPGLLTATSGAGARAKPATAGARSRHVVRLEAVAIFLLALAFRLGVILRKGAIHGIMGYDCGVYFAGADALLHGRLPYRDFTMVHPPGITLALTPLAALTRVMSDWHAFIVANVAFCFLGAVNALLVVLLSRRLGLARRGAVVAGLFYAGWYGAVSAECEVKLEPLGNFLLLLGLLALLRDQRRPTRWSAFLAGALIGLPLTVKIWWIVPVVLIFAWHATCRRSLRAMLEVVAGAAASATVVCLPFFLADPSGMWRSVVTGQFGRPRRLTTVDRLGQLSTVSELVRPLSARQQSVVAITFVVVLVAVAAFAWRGSRRARFLIVIAAAQFAVLLEAPSWFEYYSDYLAVSLAVCCGAAVVAVRREHLVRTPAVALTAALVAISCLITATGVRALGPYAGAAELTRAVRTERCVTSNSPTLLLRLDALTRGLAAGCPNWIDVSGRKMGPDSPTMLRVEHRNWAEALASYLASGDAAALWLPNGPQSLSTVQRLLRKNGILARVGDHVIYRGRAGG